MSTTQAQRNDWYVHSISFPSRAWVSLTAISVFNIHQYIHSKAAEADQFKSEYALSLFYDHIDRTMIDKSSVDSAQQANATSQEPAGKPLPNTQASLSFGKQSRRPRPVVNLPKPSNESSTPEVQVRRDDSTTNSTTKSGATNDTPKKNLFDPSSNPFSKFLNDGRDTSVPIIFGKR